MLAIIGGTGSPGCPRSPSRIAKSSARPTASRRRRWCSAQIAGRDAIFLARHGHGHTIPPHRVNYRANLWALKRAGATAIAGRRVGRRHPRLRARRPRAAAPADRLHARTATQRSSTAATSRSCTSISPTRTRRRCARSASPARAAAGIALRDGGVYGAVSGPRLETAAEIDRMDRDGATLVGMTGMPEAGARARTRAAVMRRSCVVVNHAAGRGDSAHARLDGRHRESARKPRWTRCARCSSTSCRCIVRGGADR